MIGRLKRSINERCPECRNILQIRVRDIDEIRSGIPIVISEEYIVCSNKSCGYEREMEQKRIRRQEDDLAF
jgi:hypothetical protein